MTYHRHDGFIFKFQRESDGSTVVTTFHEHKGGVYDANLPQTNPYREPRPSFNPDQPDEGLLTQVGIPVAIRSGPDLEGDVHRLVESISPDFDGELADFLRLALQA